MNIISSIIIGIGLIAVIAAIIGYMIKNKRQGKSSCGCGCRNCAMNDSCHSGKKGITMANIPFQKNKTY